MNKVIVKIAGAEYPIVGEESIEYLSFLGEYVNNEVESVSMKMPTATLAIKATLAAINIADRLLNSSNEEKSNSFDEILKIKLEEKDDEIERLNKKIQDLNKKANQNNESRNLKIELDEMLEISNGFQNRIFELQEELELTKLKLESIEKKNV